MPAEDSAGGRADDPVVLVVEDEPDVAETYELWLSSEYEVRTAPDGETALERFDESVRVVLLDRHMPGLSGRETLARLRAAEPAAPVAMVTAVEPDLDLVGTAFDAYLTKPVTAAELRSAIEELLDRAEAADAVQAHYRVAETAAVLEKTLAPDRLAQSEAYDDLLAEVERTRDRVREHDATLDGEGFHEALAEIDGATGEDEGPVADPKTRAQDRDGGGDGDAEEDGGGA